MMANFVTFVLFVVINFLTTKDTKHTKEEGKGRQGKLFDREQSEPVRLASRRGARG